MYKATEKGFEWDGIHNGKLCSAGIYAYMVEVNYTTGESEILSGNITLVR